MISLQAISRGDAGLGKEMSPIQYTAYIWTHVVGNAPSLRRYSPILRDLYDSILHSPDTILRSQTLTSHPDIVVL
jgi:hypothetical protein